LKIGALGRRHFDFEDVAAHRFDEHLVLQQRSANPLRIGVGLVDLVDRDDHRDLGRLGVRDRLDRLRHDRVVGRDHEDDDIGDLRAACPHLREGGVTRRIDERDLLAALLDLVGADMLRDASGLAGGDAGLPDRIEQRGLAVVDMAHHGHDRRPRHQMRTLVGRRVEAFLDVRLGDPLGGVAHILDDELGQVGVDDVTGLHQLPLLHQEHDHVRSLLGHAVGELLERDRLRNGHFA
jgi:hypothetical protein